MDHPRAEWVTPAATQLEWIRRVVGAGIRRPGWPADIAVERWAADQLRALGLEVRLEPVEHPVWHSDGAVLTAWPDGRPEEAIVLEGLALPHTLPADGLQRPLVRFDPDADGEQPDVRDRIVVQQQSFTVVPQALLAPAATAVHDPDGEFATLHQTLPFGPRMQLVAEPAIEAGAAGFVGVLSGVPWETHDYYVPYDGHERPLSGLWLSRAQGAALDRLLDRGPVVGRLDIDGRRGTGVSHNVVATLPGPSASWVIVGSHHDAPWASAVEDGTGIALVLAQAAYWARVPVEHRPHGLLFLLTAGHMCHAAGTAAFIAAHRDLLDATVLELHLEHAAAETVGDGSGGLVTTGQPEVRWWFTTREPQLEASVAAALAAEDLRRSLVLPPEIFMEHPPTDGGFFHLAGVPLVDFLAAPMYLFDRADTVDKVHVPSLEPITRAAVRIVAGTAHRTPASARGHVA